jgi:hypothetical protein
MSFATVVDRVRMDFVEMPEMELTLPQAVRLWSLAWTIAGSSSMHSWMLAFWRGPRSAPS